MNHSDKARFILALHKHSLQAYDVGGDIHQDPNQISKGTEQAYHPTGGYNPAADAYGALGTPIQNTINGVGGMVKGIGDAFTTQNNYQAQLAPISLYNYGGTMGASAGNTIAGYGTNQDILGRQKDLEMQLQTQAAGNGPNPAQAALAQETGKNVANQAALMAGQRGASSNVGLMARQAAQQGAETQQQSIGQAATLQAQQQIAAQQAMAQQQQAEQSANTAEQNVNANIYGTASSANNAQNNSLIQNYGMAQGLNQNTAEKNAEASNKTTSGLIGGASSALAMLSKGGQVYKPNSYVMPQMSHGGDAKIPKSFAAKWLKEGKMGSPELASQGGKVDVSNPKQKAVVKDDSVKNDKVPAMLSQDEIVIPRRISMHPNAPQMAAQFVAQAIAKRRVGKK